jgi:tellurite resistance protein TehA-like permease
MSIYFLVLGFGYLCLCIALICIADIFIQRKVPAYSLIWRSFVFPSITLVRAWSELAKAMDSPAFRGLSAALFVLEVVLYAGNLALIVMNVVNGKLIWARCEIEREEELIRGAGDGKEK